jgi:hypothetical protein
LAAAALVPLHEIPDALGQFAALQIAAPADFIGDVFRNVVFLRLRPPCWVSLSDV